MRLYEAVARFRRRNETSGAGSCFLRDERHHRDMPTTSTSIPPHACVCPIVEHADVVAHVDLCRAHARLTLRVRGFTKASAGQFVQLSPAPIGADCAVGMPFLPRAFSIGGLRAAVDGCEIDIIYRVVGVATRWMHTLRPGQRAQVLGPLGVGFSQWPDRRNALLVAGGVGLPPLLYLAQALRSADKRTVVLLGAAAADLVPLDLRGAPPAVDASRATACAREFAELGVDTIISTDDGSCGYRGTVVDALRAFSTANRVDPADTVVYTCGPERMMRAVADWCAGAEIPCQVCMERPMACGMGTCQSCIITVHGDSPNEPSRYALCCTEGPVFNAERIAWDERCA